MSSSNSGLSVARKRKLEPENAAFWNDSEVLEWFAEIGYSDDNCPIKLKVSRFKMLGKSLLKMSADMLRIKEEIGELAAITFEDHLSDLKTKALSAATMEPQIVNQIAAEHVKVTKKKRKEPKLSTLLERASIMTPSLSVVEQEVASRTSSISSTSSFSSETSSTSHSTTSVPVPPSTPRPVAVPTVDLSDCSPNRVVISRNLLKEHGWYFFTHTSLGPCWIANRFTGGAKQYRTRSFDVDRDKLVEGLDYFMDREDVACSAFLRLSGKEGEKKYVLPVSMLGLSSAPKRAAPKARGSVSTSSDLISDLNGQSASDHEEEEDHEVVQEAESVEDTVVVVVSGEMTHDVRRVSFDGQSADGETSSPALSVLSSQDVLIPTQQNEAEEEQRQVENVTMDEKESGEVFEVLDDDEEEEEEVKVDGNN